MNEWRDLAMAFLLGEVDKPSMKKAAYELLGREVVIVTNSPRVMVGEPDDKLVTIYDQSGDTSDAPTVPLTAQQAVCEGCGVMMHLGDASVVFVRYPGLRGAPDARCFFHSKECYLDHCQPGGSIEVEKGDAL